MNTTIETLLNKNNLDLESCERNFYSIKSCSDINHILNKYYIPGKKIKKEISIAEILGYNYEEYGLSKNLITNLSHFFDANGTSYQKRSVGMVFMDRDEAVTTLIDVSKRDTIYLRECEKNKYIISTNGLHRYNVLRFHYLNELSEINPQDKERIKELKQKYTIPVEVQEPDYNKTYAYYILRKIIPNIEIFSELDCDYNRTGNVVVKHNDVEQVYTDSQLIFMLQKTIDLNQDIMPKIMDSIEHCIETLPTFRNFLDENNIDLYSQEALV